MLFILILAVFITALILSIILQSDIQEIMIIIAFIMAVMFIISSIGLVVGRIDNTSKIKGFNAVRETVMQARLNGINIENTALQLKIAEMNQWLMETKYLANNFWVGIYYPTTEINKLEPIK